MFFRVFIGKVLQYFFKFAKLIHKHTNSNMRKLFSVLTIMVFGFVSIPTLLFSQATELEVVLSTVDNGCGINGSASIMVVSSCGGNPTVEWSSSANNGFTETNLANGSYSVTVTDNDPACGDTIIDFNISDAGPFAVSVVPSGNSCSGSMTLTAMIDGANPDDVTYSWNDVPNSSTPSITVSEGLYTCSVTYGNCSDESSFEVAAGNFEFEVVYTPVVCIGSTGAANFNAISGSGNYQYEWSTGDISSGTILPGAGDYCLTATDLDANCQDVFCFTVTEVDAIDIVLNYDDISCYGESDGWIQAIVSGGTPDYEYEWSISQSSEIISNLVSGNYSVTVEDLNGCSATETQFIAEPPVFNYTISAGGGICLGEQFDLDVFASGGTGDYTYDWSDAENMNVASRTVQPTETYTYTVTAIDENGCTSDPVTATVEVSQPIVIDVTTVDVLCHGLCTGSATLVHEGGLPLFEYSWESSTDYIQNLCAGEYEVTITDKYDCEGFASFEITEPDTILLTTTAIPATCFGYNDGAIQVEVNGGVPFIDGSEETYNYLWSNGSTLDSLASYAGSFVVTVTDANDCTQTGSAFVNQPTAIYVEPLYENTICKGADYTQNANASGGTLSPDTDYSYVWTSGDFTMYGNTLSVNPEETTTYQLVVTDDNDCFGPVQTITIGVHPDVDITSITSSESDICIGESIDVELEFGGGQGQFYTISRVGHGIVNGNPNTFYPDESGYYVYEVSDECGAVTSDIDSIYVEIHQPPQVAFIADHTSSCPPSVFYFTETTLDQGQTYLWDFGDGGFSVQKNPVHTYSETGFYDVSLTAWSEWGCESVFEYNDMIRIYPVPRAEFAGTPEIVSIFNPMVEFINYTDGGETYFWDFGDGESSLWTNETQIHIFDDLGEYEVMMIAKNQFECYDTAYKKIRVHDEFTFFAPEAFTPNGDGLNDVFYVTGHGVDPTQFYFVIYDRFGTKVFETETFDEDNVYRMAWDGSHKGDVLKGDPVMGNGMYRWYCSFVDTNGKPREESGTVTLIK